MPLLGVAFAEGGELIEGFLDGERFGVALGVEPIGTDDTVFGMVLAPGEGQI